MHIFIRHVPSVRCHSARAKSTRQLLLKNPHKLKEIMKPLNYTYAGLCSRNCSELKIPSSETKYNQHTAEVKEDIRATAQILSLLLASSRIDSKFIKQMWHAIQAWLLTSGIIFLSGSNPIKCSHQAQDLSSHDVRNHFSNGIKNWTL